MRKYLKKGWKILKNTQFFFQEGLQRRLFKDYVHAFLGLASEHLNKFHRHLQEMTEDKHKQFDILQKRIKGLHSLLPDADRYACSILISLENPSPKLLHSCLLSACRQTPPAFDILLGHKSALTPEVLKIIQDLESNYPDKIQRLCFSESTNEPIYNLLAQASTKNYLYFLEQEDWIRPDLLYRFEQYLRTYSNPENTALNCFENSISENEHFIPGSTNPKPSLNFPYVFQPAFNFRSLLLSKQLWNKIKGVPKEFMEAAAAALMFNLDLAGAHFSTIPLCLYSRRKKRNNLQSETTLPAFLEAFKEYAATKNLDWTFQTGYHKDSLRAIPQNLQPHKIQVIIPFKDQKDLTLRCLDSVLKQKGVNYTVTAIDNGSEDLSIGHAISQMGGEVLKIEEPFNYSRLNNLAVTNSASAQDCDLLLFLNNDVELEEEALLEMTRWIDQPSIGMVGARLHYPNGQLQHGGVTRDSFSFPELICWEHHEKFKSFEEMDKTKILGVVDAVTAACALIKKEHFLKVGGFDEILYPIAFSDTNLAVKLDVLGLKSFYTPYACGIHHESISRKEVLEDVDSSRWLYDLGNCS